MLTPDAFEAYCNRCRFSPAARSQIQAIRSSPPARRVRGAAGNVRVRYPSRKMGVTIQAESHKNELAGIYEMEFDPQTLEYYDQPPAIKLDYVAKHGKAVGVWHTPDFFVLRADAAGWEEWKTEDELLTLAVEKPNRYQAAEDGQWRCPPGEQYAAPYGLYYRVRSSAGINWVLQRNLVFLEDYLRGDVSRVGAEVTQTVRLLVASQPGLTLAEMFRQAEGASRDDLHTLIATGQVYVDLYAAALAEPERVRVFCDEAIARAYALINPPAAEVSPLDAPRVPRQVGTRVAWDGRCWALVNCGEMTTALLAEDRTLIELPNTTFEGLIQHGKLTALNGSAPGGLSAEAQELLARAGPKAFQEANRRYALLTPRLAGEAASAETTPARTLRHWLFQWREAERRHGCGYLGLLPRDGERGNRQRKLPENTLGAMEAFIANDYETLKQKPKYEVYGALVRACGERGLTAPSYKTFVRAIERRPRQAQVEKRQGRRAAYQHAPFYWELVLTTPRHGDRPFEIGHIDHTELDLELVCSRTGRNLGRPWATFLTDAFSRCLLAVYLTFEPPSYRACMMILRECVRRHGRLPQILVVDGGPEFASTYFETLLARYECTKKTRPGAQARFGSVCERLFGTTNTRFVHNLLGNTQLTRNVRQVTQAVDPKAHACWTLGRLSARLGEWAYQVYETLAHPALGQTPREALAAGLAQGGQREQRRIPYDEDFRLFTLPTTRKGTAKVVPSLGVKIGYIHYWSEAFLDPQVERVQVPIRYDPFDAGMAYAFVQGRWVRCISEHYARFAGRSEREMMLATAELRRRNQCHTQQFVVTARKLADFLASLEAEEALLEQRLQDAAAKEVLAQSRGEAAAPSAVAPAASSVDVNGDTPELGRAAQQEPAPVPPALLIYEDY